MMDLFLKVAQGSFHQAMYVLVQQLADDLSRVICFDFIAHARQARNTHRSAEKAVFMYIACREIKTNRTTTSHLYMLCTLFSVVYSVVKRQVYWGFEGY